MNSLVGWHLQIVQFVLNNHRIWNCFWLSSSEYIALSIVDMYKYIDCLKLSLNTLLSILDILTALSTTFAVEFTKMGCPYFLQSNLSGGWGNPHMVISSRIEMESDVCNVLSEKKKAQQYGWSALQTTVGFSFYLTCQNSLPNPHPPNHTFIQKSWQYPSHSSCQSQKFSVSIVWYSNYLHYSFSHH